ncbi:unnamed protein product [Amaranthus hypochondriacus]
MLTSFHSITLSTLFLLLLFLHPLSATHHHIHRRILHHPFFLPTSPSPSPSLPPSPPLPKHPFSDSFPASPPTTPSTSDSTGENPFFPTYPASPPPPSPPSTSALPTFPANISSLALPSSSSSSSSHAHSPLSSKLIIILILLSLLTISLIVSLSLLLHRRRRPHSKQLPHYPSLKPQSPPLSPPKVVQTKTHHNVSHTSSDFLYVGNTLTNSRDFQPFTDTSIEIPSTSSEIYLKLCGDSPELRPLPPLPKISSSHVSFEQQAQTTHVYTNKNDDDEYFSPTSFSKKVSFEEDNYGLNCSPARSYSDFPASDSDVSVEIQTLAARTHHFPTSRKVGPPDPPPPPPPPMAGVGPPPLVPPSGPVVFKSSGNLGEKRKSGERKSGERKEENLKPKLKALHWDKVRASSDRVMVWDQLKPGSFQLNEEMIETLFKANGPNGASKDGPRRSIIPSMDEEYRILDPKKSQNIAILLKALNVTEQEVCEALLEGTADALGTELLECLLKMAPTIEEERKLREYCDESPLKLGPAEKFLKAVLDHVPFAFKRVDAMLYIATFESEVEYLRKSFETLEAACAELRNSRMFLKLLEAVLKTGNRMNVGTNRGDAQAFKLDTLLKLIDVKGTDGKTTLLHFVVQEIIKLEGSRVSTTKNNSPAERTNGQPSLHNDIELRKRGLEVVTGLGGELMNVKKAAAMDSNSLSMDVTKLARGIIKVGEVLQLNEKSGLVKTSKRFTESMNGFLKKAEVEIVKIQSQESNTLSRVKELTEYFHGNLAQEEARPLRIFIVVKDFLGVLDQVCKEVAKITERTFISSARPIPTSANPPAPPPPPFPEFCRTQGDSSSDNESISEK